MLDDSSRSDLRHPRRSPEILPLLDILAAFDVQYVLTGSVAALLYGVEVQPGDLDITPALDPNNLRRLVAVLREIDALPESPAGRWTIQPNGERRWIAEELSEVERIARANAWQPDPDDITTLDHLFRSRYGNFDVVPEIAGSYEYLMQRAQRMQHGGRTLWVTHIDDLLVTLTVPRRSKDVARVQALRDLQHRRGTQD